MFNLAKCATEGSIGKNLGRTAFKKVPIVYKQGVGKTKNQRIRKALSSDLANTVLEYGSIYL